MIWSLYVHQFSIKMYNLNRKLILKFYKLYVGGSILRGHIAAFCVGLAQRGFYKAWFLQFLLLGFGSTIAIHSAYSLGYSRYCHP